MIRRAAAEISSPWADLRSFSKYVRSGGVTRGHSNSHAPRHYNLQSDLGEGSYWFDSGPLPFTLGPLPPEGYEWIRLGSSFDASDAAGKDSLPAFWP
jgi:hypothetical protein